MTNNAGFNDNTVNKLKTNRLRVDCRIRDNIINAGYKRQYYFSGKLVYKMRKQISESSCK